MQARFICGVLITPDTDPWSYLGKFDFNAVLGAVGKQILGNIYVTLLALGIACAILTLCADGVMYIVRANTTFHLHMLKERIISHILLIAAILSASEIVALIVNLAIRLM